MRIRTFLKFGWLLIHRGPGDLYQLLVTHWPGRAGHRLRYRYYSDRLRHLGSDVTLDVGVHLVNPQLISIGDGSHIDRGVTIIAGPPAQRGRRIHRKANAQYDGEPGEVRIGREVHIAPYAYLLGCGGIAVGDRCCITSGARVYSISNHYQNLDDPADCTRYSFSNCAPDEQQALIVSPVVLGENSAVGLNSVVLPGSTIGRDGWLGAMSLLRGEVPADCIATGCPAQVIKQRR